LHLARRDGSSESSVEFDPTIVNPRHLSRDESESICAQCHLHGVATVSLRGRDLSDFRPGLSLHDFAIHYGTTTPEQSMQVVGHIEQLRLSRCYESSETLTCTTCHSPHHDIEPERSIEHFRSKCLSCHEKQGCGLEIEKRLRQDADDNCVKCHMPRGPTEIPHFAFTHHRIGIHNKKHVENNDQEIVIPVPLSPISHLPPIEQDRCLGLAYLQLSDAPGHSANGEIYREKALQILMGVSERGLNDAQLNAALSRLYWQQNPQKSIRFGKAVLTDFARSPDAQATALFTIGSSYFINKQYQLAVPYLEQTVRVRRYARPWSMLSICRKANGDLDGAMDAARSAIAINPYLPIFQKRLADLYEEVGETELSRKHRNIADLLANPTPNRLSR